MLSLFAFDAVSEKIAAFHHRQQIWLIVGAVIMGLFLIFFLLMIRKILKLRKTMHLDQVPGMIGEAIERYQADRSADQNAPQQTVAARCVTKRTQVFGRHSFTHYYIGFELDNGDRIELSAEGKQFGLIAEGDRGDLTYRGSTLISFNR